MSELNAVKLQAENIDLRTQLERAAARLEKLHHIVMKTADVHVLADELEGTETDDEFFAVLKRKVRHAAKEAEDEGKFGMVPMEEFEAMDQELQKALERETDMRTKIDLQANELRHAKAESRKAADAAKALAREVEDLKVERSVLQEAVEELTGAALPSPPGTPPPPPPQSAPAPPPPPAANVSGGDLQTKLRKAIEAAEKAEAERKIALHVKERALKETATALTDNARLQGIIDGSRRGEDSAAQLALKARKEELDETRELLLLSEKRSAALQKRVGTAELERLEATALSKELENAQKRTLGSGGSQPTLVGAGQLLDLRELLLPPAPPPRDDNAAAAAAARETPSPLGATGLAASSSTIPQQDRDVLRARLLTRSRAVPLDADVLDSSINALQRTYRRLLAEARSQDPGNAAGQHACLLDCLLEKEVQVQQLHRVLESMEAAFGTRIAAKEAEGAAYYGRAVAAEGRLKDLKNAAHGLHLELADVVATTSGAGAGSSPVAAALFESPQRVGSASPAGATPGTETANRASRLLHQIAELNGLLSSFAGPGKAAAGATTDGAATEGAAAETPSRQILKSDASPMSPGTAADNGGASPVSRSAARHSQRTLDLIARVREKQRAKQSQATSTAATVTSAASGNRRERDDATSPRSDESPVYDAARIDEALRRAAPVAEHIQRVIEAEAEAAAAAASSPPNAPSGTGTAAPSPHHHHQSPATSEGGGGGDAAAAAAVGKGMEELLGVLTDRETEITRLEETAASQATLIQLLKNATSLDTAPAGLPSADSTIASLGGTANGQHHVDPLGATASSFAGTSPGASIAVTEEFAAAKARLAVSEKRLSEAQGELDELRGQARGLQFLLDEERAAAKARVAAAESRADTGASMAQQREAERDRAIATGRRLEAAVKRREERTALGREQSVVIGGDGVGSPLGTGGGAAAFDDGDDLLPASPAKSIVVTPAMDTAVFAATLAKVKPRVSVDEETAANILSEAVESYEQLLNRVAQHQEAVKQQQQQQQPGSGAHPSAGFSSGVGGDTSGLAAATSHAADAAGLDPEHLHEQALLELLFDLKLKMWHSQNDYRSMRAIVDIKMEDKEQERKDAVEPLKSHIAALQEQVTRLTPRVQNAEAEVERRGHVIADLQGRLGQPPGSFAVAAQPVEGGGIPPHVVAEVERSLQEATSRIELLKEQLKAQGITPNC